MTATLALGICAFVFFASMAGMVAVDVALWWRRGGDTVDRLTAEQLDHDVLMCQFERITEGLDR